MERDILCEVRGNMYSCEYRTSEQESPTDFSTPSEFQRVVSFTDYMRVLVRWIREC